MTKHLSRNTVLFRHIVSFSAVNRRKLLVLKKFPRSECPDNYEVYFSLCCCMILLHVSLSVLS